MTAASGERKESHLSTQAGWLVPSLAYVLLMGGLGILTKYALRYMGWQDMIVWTALVYAIVAIALLAFGGAKLSIGAGSIFAIGAGLCAALALVVFYVALNHGDASQVVPVTSAYPIVTLVLAAMLLAEGITPVKIVSVVLVVLGVSLLATGQ